MEGRLASNRLSFTWLLVRCRLLVQLQVADVLLRVTLRTIPDFKQILYVCRSVSKEDKTMTIGISQAILQVMGLMPAPIIYGMIMGMSILTYTCAWGRTCAVFCKLLYNPFQITLVLYGKRTVVVLRDSVYYTTKIA